MATVAVNWSRLTTVTPPPPPYHLTACLWQRYEYLYPGREVEEEDPWSTMPEAVPAIPYSAAPLLVEVSQEAVAAARGSASATMPVHRWAGVAAPDSTKPKLWFV